MNLPHEIIPIIAILMVFGMPIAIVAIVRIGKSRDNAELQKTLRMSIEKGQPLPTEFLDSLQKSQVRVKTPANDIRTGIILIAIALGVVVWNFLDNGYTVDEMSGLAAIPGFIGVALLILGLIGNRKQ
ncbi:hypothetical protein MMA231_01750 [Asticcacaulis sp. MM231]|uniref:DUF6249 domain-containing protein n=1 Tax=Asticcacaulis sp. MM231 TaxID=3157666 RepID=UPI0032D5A0F3